jgi:hypothetical protein
MGTGDCPKRRVVANALVGVPSQAPAADAHLTNAADVAPTDMAPEYRGCS